MHMFGLLGRRLGYSFSQTYFTDKFERLGLADHEYRNFEIESAGELSGILRAHPGLRGLNVTIPYKTDVLPLLDEVRGAAAEIGAVNTIVRDGSRLIGYNTDVVGFELTLKPFLAPLQDAGHAAVLLGNGGAAAAVKWVLAEAQLPYDVYTRRPGRFPGARDFSALADLPDRHPRLVVNTTPVGTHPDVDAMPPFPPERFGEGDVVIDLIYNPPRTRLLREAERRGAKTANGGLMLREQAEAAWRLWTAETPPPA